MAVVIVYARHSTKCPKSKVKGAGQFRRCKCPLWLRSGNDKRSAKTRSWEIANKKARLLEEELDLKAMGVEPPKAPEHISIEAAAELYLADMVQRGKGTGKTGRMLQRVQDFSNENNIMLLKDVTVRLLTEWRGKWTFDVKSSSPAVHWAVVRTFFRWAYATELILVDRETGDYSNWVSGIAESRRLPLHWIPNADAGAIRETENERLLVER